MWSVKKGRVGERKEKTGGLGVGKGVVVGKAQQVGGYACCVFFRTMHGSLLPAIDSGPK